MAYRYLAAEGAWPDVVLNGLEVGAGGVLKLADVPYPSEAVTDPLPPVPGLEGPAGLAVDPQGNVYVSDPAGHRILVLDACSDEVRALRCIRGPGDGPGELRTPRGLAVDALGRLLVADSENRRIQLFDLGTGQLTGVWAGPWTGPGGKPLELAAPWDLAVTSRCEVYVADAGTPTAAGGRRGGRVLKLDRRGEVDLAFLERMQSGAARPQAPASVAIVMDPGSEERAERLLVLDNGPPTLLAYHLDGRFDPAATATWRRAAGAFGDANVISHLGGRLYVGTPRGGALAFDLDGRLLGRAGAAGAAVAGIALDCLGRLLVHPGGGGSVLRAQGAPTYAPCGTFVAGPYTAVSGNTRWQRLRVDLSHLPEGSHLRLFTLVSDTLDGTDDDSTPAAPSCTGTGASAAAGGAGPAWSGAPLDYADVHIHASPGRYLWVAGALWGDRRGTPLIRQVRVDYDRDGWLGRLPQMYRRDARTRTMLEPFLGVFETAHEDAARQVDRLPMLFDPQAAPDVPASSWLEWLASWVGVSLREGWPEARRRAVVAEAFRTHALRGTAEHLREIVWLHTGVRPRIIEGAASGDVWVLGASPLGLESRPAAFPAQGAVLDTTAVVDGSHIRGSGRYGAELFDDALPCLFVHVYRAEVRDQRTLDGVRQILDQEVPAHLVYRLCVIEPRMRVGHQASLGIDAIVGGPPTPPRADEPMVLGSNSVLTLPRRPVPRPSVGSARVSSLIR